MNSAAVVMKTLPCIAITAGTPASASRGPSAAIPTPPLPALWHEASTTMRGL